MEMSELIELNRRLLESHNELKNEIVNLNEFIHSQVNQRLLTVEWMTQNSKFAIEHLVTLNQQQVKEINLEKLKQPLEDYVFKGEQYVALNSLDNIEPESTFEGEVSKPQFVTACERVTDKQYLRFLDIGCGSGALIMDFLLRGHFAVGIDGSDACKKFNKGYWNSIPNLHNCDITKPFEFKQPQNDIPLLFDVISMWEVFEHIPESECANVLKNVSACLSDDGIFVGSISLLEYVHPRTGVPYHVTLKDKQWWAELFLSSGLEMQESPFNNYEYCRGVGGQFQDVHSYELNPEAGFWFFAKKR